MSSIRKLRRRDQMLLMRAVAKLVAAQRPLDASLLQLAEQWRGSLARAAKDVANKLAQGQTLVQAFAGDSSLDSRMLAGTIEAGQQTGELDAALESWATFQVAQARAWRSLLIAMVYPVLLLAVIAGSLLFTLRHLTPHYQTAFTSIVGYQPVWLQVTVWFSENLVFTLILLVLLLGCLPAVWMIRRLWRSPNKPSIELANRWYLHAHIARLAHWFVNKHSAIDRTFVTLLQVAGKPQTYGATTYHATTRDVPSSSTHSSTGGSPDVNLTSIHSDVEAHAWLGRETVLALVALRDGAMPIEQVRELLAAIAMQTQRMADIRSARNAQWLPMIVAMTAGIVVVVMYVGLIYGPWLTMFRLLAR